MGYASTVDGAIQISPPLSHREVKLFPEMRLKSGSKYLEDAEIALIVRTDIIETDDGQILRQSAEIIEPMEGNSSWKRSHSQQQLQTVVDTYPDHEFSGLFEFLGEDGKLWRLVIKGREVVKIRPEITWPDA